MKKLLLKLFVSGLVLAGCGSSNDSSQDSSGSNETAKITAVGSTALQPLVDAAQESYVAEHPNVQISVQGGGSGTGLSQINSGAVEIGNSDIFAEAGEGVDASKLVDHKVAVVGFAPVVNKDVGVEDVSKQELIDIFTGKITNWSELGGEDQEINLINRASGSGTRATFEEFALDGQEPIKAQEQDSSGTVKKIVGDTPGAISYLALSYLDDSLQALKIDGVTANAKNIETNDWKIWSYEHMYTNGEPEGALKDFMDYMTTDEIQNGPVKELGYLPITEMKVERDAEGTVTNL